MNIRCLFKHNLKKEQTRLITGELYSCTRCGTYIIQNSIGSYECTPEQVLKEVERGVRYHRIRARQESAQEEFEFLLVLRESEGSSYDSRQMQYLRERVRDLQVLMDELTKEILHDVEKEGIKWLK